MKLITFLNKSITGTRSEAQQTNALAPDPAPTQPDFQESGCKSWECKISEHSVINAPVASHMESFPSPVVSNGTVEGASFSSASQKTRPILMCFSQITPFWYCSFFEDERRTKRLPRRLTFRNSTKLWIAAKNGNAELDSDAVRFKLEADIKDGRGSIWLRMSDQQIATLA